MKRNRVTISLLALATVLAVEGARAADQVAMLITPAVHDALKQEIKRTSTSCLSTKIKMVSMTLILPSRSSRSGWPTSAPAKRLWRMTFPDCAGSLSRHMSIISELAEFKTGALFTVNHGCSTANWARNEAEGNAPNTAMSWVFGKGIGQAVVGQVRVGMIYGQDRLYEAMLAGDYLGKAYLEAKKAAEAEMNHGDKEPGDIVSGVLFIGNPFLQIKSL